jgi:regulator of RNase E activity RraA
VLDGLGYRESYLGADIAALYPSAVVVGRAFPIAAQEVPSAADPLRPADPYRRLLDSFAGMRSGDVVVIGTGGERRSGVWGELLTIAAMARGVTGVVTDGLVRDPEQTERLGFPIFGGGVSPLDSAGRLDVVGFGGTITCGNATVTRNDYLLGDRMGVVVIPGSALAEVLQRAEDKRRGEGITRQALAAGEPIDEVFARYGVL